MGAIEIHSDLPDLPQVVKLLHDPDGAVAMAGWVMSLTWMNRIGEDVIPIELLARYGCERKHADLLILAGLFAERADGEFEPLRVDAKGRPLWRPEPRSSRPAIPRAVRDAVFQRDGRRCGECEATDDLTLDHVHPWSLGGVDTVDNLRVLCRPCNSRKGARV